MPVGQGNDIGRAIDTIKSIEHYTTDDRLIILLDDSKIGAGYYINSVFPNLKIIKNDISGTGPFGRLYVGITDVFKYVLQYYEFDTLLRIDTDSLIIGQYPENEAISYFEKNSTTGLLGSYKKNCLEDIRDVTPVIKILKRETGYIKKLTMPKLANTLNKTVKCAIKKGYELGEHCLGAACFISYPCLKTIQKEGYLSFNDITKSRLSDDHILGLIVRATGYNIEDFSIGNYPLCLKWKGLSYPPDKLIAMGKKIIHSTKNDKNFGEIEIREYFRNIRNGQIQREKR